jgi:hypothetical protein
VLASVIASVVTSVAVQEVDAHGWSVTQVHMAVFLSVHLGLLGLM